MSENLKIEVGRIGRGLIALDMPEGSTISEAIKISGYHFSEETRIKLSREPEANEGTELQDGDRIYLVDNLQGGMS